MQFESVVYCRFTLSNALSITEFVTHCVLTLPRRRSNVTPTRYGASALQLHALCSLVLLARINIGLLEVAFTELQLWLQRHRSKGLLHSNRSSVSDP